MSDDIKIYDDLGRHYIKLGLEHYIHSILYDFYLFLIRQDLVDRRQAEKFGYEYIQDFMEELNDETDEVSN